MSPSRKILAASTAASLLMGMAFYPTHAQQAPNGGPDFDPVTRAFSNQNPPIPGPNQPQTPGQPLTPEQLQQQQLQQQQAKLEQMKEEARKKHEEAEKARKEKEAAEKAAEQKKMEAIKQARMAREEEMKHDQEELKSLLQEEKDARKAYQDAKKNATGDTSQIDTDYHKAEADRQAKIRELRHPKYKPLKDYLNASGSSTPGTATPGTATPGGTIALPGSVTSGSGPNVTVH